MLLLILPLIAVETLARRLLGPLSGPTAGPDLPVEEKEIGATQEDERSGPTFSYLCCLSVWVIVALNVRWRWKSEEAWSVACLHRTSSLVRCLPKLFSPIPIVVEPFWGVFLFLLLLLLTMNTSLHRRRRGPGQTELTHTTEDGAKDLVPVEPASSGPGLSDSDVDPGKTRSSCPLRRALLWNSLQMPTRHHGDAPKHERTKGGATVTFLLVGHEEPRHRHRWGFPCLGASAMIGLVVVLSVLVLPLNLSVNILVIRTVETLLELWAKCLVSFASDTIEIPALRHEMLV